MIDLTKDELVLKVAELLDAHEVLTAETARLRHSNRILRTVNRSLRNQLNIAHMNDELMKELCFNIEDDMEIAEGGLPAADPS